MSRRIVTPVVVVVGVIAGGTVLARLLGYKLGGNPVVVRCRQGHVVTTSWIPGVKLKGLDLVAARIQHCPVGKHWSLVVPVRDADLTEGERQFARAHHDLPHSLTGCRSTGPQPPGSPGAPPRPGAPRSPSCSR